MKLYAAIIGKNEEKALPKCLASLKGFDRIFYTDTGSTDNSCAIAHRHKAKISYRKWDNDFSKARNFNLDQIPKDEWVFIIDCDEHLPDGEIKKIRAAIENSKTGRCFAHVKNIKDGGEHQHLRFFKNNIRYKDAWHTHIPVTHFEFTDVVLIHEPSINHQKDPKRNLRIIKNIKKKTPRLNALIGRELMGLKKYKTALIHFEKYFKNADYNQQTADALIYAAQCLFQLGKTEDAKTNCLEVIKFNPEYKEALIVMGTLCPPWQMKAWLRYAKTATNERIINIPGRQDERIAELEKVAEMANKGASVAQIRKALSKKPIKANQEKKASYYDATYKENHGTGRYENIYRKIGELATGRVLDIGCGTAQLAKFVKNYCGFDFSENAINKAIALHVWVGNVYDKKNYLNSDTYVFCEVLEHLKADFGALLNVPKGKNVILTVPSFEDPAHLRTYQNFDRYKELLNIKKIIRFNWAGEWVEGGMLTENFILLAESVRI